MKRFAISTLLLFLSLLPATTGFASEPIELRQRNSIVIDRSGSYILKRSLSARTEGPLVTIAADNVSLDLNGYGLTGLGNKVGEGIVIDGRSNVSVHNGFLRRFGTAVRVSRSSNVAISRLQITGEDIPGGPPETGILLLGSRGVRVTENVVNRTFLGIFVRGGSSGANTIKANTLSGGENGQLGICYNPAPDGDPATDGPAGDLVAENHVSRFRTGIQTSPASVGNLFVRNYLNYIEQAVEEQSPGSNTFANNQEIALP